MLSFKLNNNELDYKYIRVNVFMEEQGFQSEFDDIDLFAKHLVLYVDDKRAGCLRYYKDDDGLRIGRVAILKQYRRCGYGKELMNKVHELLKAYQGLIIYVDAQVNKIPFYESVGYQIWGKPYYDEHILHQRMMRVI